MQAHLPVPVLSGWSPQARPSPPRTNSLSRPYTRQPQFERARPTTAPTLAPTPPRSSGRGVVLPPLASIVENQGSSLKRRGSSHLTLPALLNTGAPEGSHPRRVSWSVQTTDPLSTHNRPGSSSSGWYQPSLSSSARPSLDADRPHTAGGRPSTSTSTLGPMTPGFEHPGLYFASTAMEPIYNPPRSPETSRPLSSGSATNYSRVLVGSLCSIGQRLQDANGDMGMFFFAHDLGVRTEGTFTLKFTLTDLQSSVPSSLSLLSTD